MTSIRAYQRLLAPGALFVMLTVASGIASGTPTPTTTTLNIGPSPGTAGTPITLTATITPQSAPVPTGNVHFSEASSPTVIYTSPVVNGVATLILEPPAGSYSYTAVYSGDSAHAGSTSLPVAEQVTSSTTTTLSVTPNPALFGQPVSLSAAVTPVPTGGTVTFYEHSTVVGVAPVVSGVATFVSTLLASGIRTLYARYSGDNVTGAGTSTSINVSEAILTKPGLGYGPYAGIPTGNRPIAQVVGDFNLDGKTDLAVLNATDQTITIFLGTNEGTFTVGRLLTTGPSPLGLAVGDFNGDGNLDLAVAAADGVEVLYGLGNGDFQSFQSFDVGANGASSLAVGDFNKDGLPDIAAVNGTNLEILISTGTSFNGALFAPMPIGAAGVVVGVGDFNGDGLADLVVITAGGAVVRLNTSNLTATTPTYTFGPSNTYPAGNGPNDVVIKDVNGDSYQDLLITNFIDGTVSVLLGTGTGTFNAQSVFTAGPQPTSLASSDFNGDGVSDLVVTNDITYNGASNSNISIMLGVGNGSYYEPLGYSAGPGPVAVIVQDFNGDSKPDLAVLSPGGNALDILLNLYATVAISSGNGQSVALNDSFALPLQVAVTAFGNIAANVPVTFTAPVSGAGGFFAGTGGVVTAISNASGIATPPVYTANATAGADTVSATAGGNTVSFALINNAQTCTFQVSPSTGVVFDARGGSTLFTVTASAPTCMWNAVTTSPSVLFGTTSGTGSGSVDILFPANTSGLDLAETVIIAGISIPVSVLGTTEVFNDVPPTAYYFDAVNLLFAKGITSGCAGPTPPDYCPASLVTRAEMAVFIVTSVYNGGTFVLNNPDTQYFSDVPPGSFGYNWIEKMYELGITSGCGGGEFCPNETVTRAQMAVFIVTARYGAGVSFDIPATSYFSDVPPGSFGYTWIQRFAEDGITAGCGPGLFCPTESVDRGDMAIFIMKGMFNDLYPPGTPEIASISPASIPVGQATTVTVTGASTLFDGTTVVNPNPNYTVGTVSVISPTSLTVLLTPSPGAPVTQPYSLYITTSDHNQEEVLPNGLTITAAP